METNISNQMNDFNKKKWEQLKGDYGDIVVKQIREILESNTTTTKDKLIEIFLNSKGRTPKDKELFHIILQLKEPKEEIERTEVGKIILKGFNILVGVCKVADGVTKLLAMRQNDKELQNYRQKIAELESKGDLSETEQANLELCRQELDRLMLEGAEQGLSMMSELADYIPVIGPYIREQIDLGIEVMKVGAELVMAHKKQIQEAIDWMNGNSGTVTEQDIYERLSGNEKLYSQYLEYKVLKETGIMDIVMQGADKNKKKKYQKNLSYFENEWNQLGVLIEQLNGKLKSLAKTKEPWEKVETFYQYDLEKGLEKVKDAQGDVTRPYDPLVVDLNHNGFDLHSVENGVYFDLDNNGTKEKTSWVDKQDGFLVMDQNGNGKIDTGAELFGEKVLLKNGQYSNGAIDVLSEFDENGDGIIDDKDSVFDKLMIWQDLNHNGISEEGELKTLKEHHIVGLKLTDIQSHQRNIAGSTLRKSMTYIYEETVTNEKGEEIKSQKEGTIGEFLLAKDNIDTHDTEQGQDMLSQLDLSKEDEAALYHTVKNLPDIRSFGRFKRLHNAMVLDKSGVLVGLVQQFQNSTNIAERENLLEQILLFMADATDVDASAKGQYANAKHIKVLEHIFDNPLIEGVLDKRLGQTYEDAYHDIKSVYYTTLSMQTGLKDMQEFFLSKENKLINITLLNKYLEMQLLQNKENADFLFEETTKVLMYLDSLGIEGFEQFKHHFGSLSTRYFHKFAELNVKQYRENSDSTTTYLYTKGVTIHAGDGNNTIQGTFNGRSGNDYIYAGKGNDMIYGGMGSDTYFFERGDGNDTIQESINAKDTNIVVFGKGIKKENLQIRRLNHHDVKITIKGTDDSLTIQGQIQNNEKGAIDEFFFFDGERMTYQELKESANQITTGDDFIETTNDNDEIDLLSGDDTVYTKSGKDTIHGNAGADTIYAGEGDDILYGDEGSDKLYGENGEDTLIGGTGDDYLNGGYGADTYLFHKGDGIDTIEEYDYNTQNIDKIQLDKDIKKEDIILNRKGNDLEITFKVGNDKIIVKNQFANANSTIEQIVYGNNQIIAFQEMLDTTNRNSQKEHLLQGAYTDDILVGSQESDTIHGYDGQDQITGGKGDDILDGGYGNDTYYYNKGDGSDIITDYSGNNTLILGEGISKDKVVFTRVSREDIVMSIVGTEDKITIKNQWNNRTIDKVQFHDGSSLTYDQIKSIVNTPTDRDDYLEGTSGADILEGGKGNDYLNGGYGGDTYIFSRGDGQDTIEDYSGGYEGIDKLIFKDINREDVIFSRESENDITILVKNSNDKIKIKYGNNSYRAIEEIHFANGEVMTYEEMMKQPFEYYGDEQDNTIKTYSTDDKIFAGAGDDTINAGDGNNTVYGQDGDDKIYTGSGADILEGGKGNDYLNGGYGGDTYVFSRGDGQDTIEDYSGGYEGVDKLIFKDINREDVIFSRESENDITILVKNSNDKIKIKYGNNSYRAIEEIHFANGEVMTYEEMMKQPFEYYGDEQDNTIKTYSTDDKIFAGAGDDTINAGDGNNTVYGQDGDDKIYTGSGADILEGGKGNDYLNGGYGGDTYVFSRGDGQDTIEDYSGGYEGVDKLIFKDINREDVIFSRESENDITILVKNSNDKIKIKYGNNSYRAIEEIHFANGEVMTYEEMMKQPFEYYGDEQDNTIKTYSTDDKIFAGAGDDTINAGDGNNTVYGQDGDDKIYTGSGADILEGGKGNDYLNGGYGGDTYVFSRGDGQDTIEDYSGGYEGVDKLIFKDINREDVIFSRESENDITILVKNSNDKIKIKYGNNSYRAIEEIHFANGEVMTYEEMMKQPFEYYGDEQDNTIKTYSTDDKIFAGAGDDTINAGDGNNTVYGQDGDDKIYTGSGADILEGGKGNDYLNGGYGGDTYVFSRGDGQDTIEDYSGGYEGVDKLIFKDINREDVIFSRESENDITILVKNSNDKIKIKYGNNSYRAIEEIHFANGEVMTYEEMMKQPFEYYGDEQDNTIKTYSTDDKIFAGAGNDRIHAGDGNNIVYGGEGNDEIRSGRGNDTLVGGKGNDYLQGYYGADTYIFSRGDGQDIVDENNSDNSHSVVDKIVFTDINREDVIFTKENNSDVTIKVKGSEDKVTIKNAHSNDWQIEEIHFANGEVMTYEEMMKQPFEYYGDEKDNTINTYSTDDKIFAGAGNDRIHAGDGNNTVYGGEGNDEIRSGRGNDTLVGGKGNDYLQGYYGADTYIFSRGDGQDIVDENNSDNSHSVVDKIVFTDINREDVIFTKENNSDVTIKVKGSEDKVTIKNAHSNDWQIEEIHFANGEVMTYEEMMKQPFEYYGDEKDNTINTYSTDDKIFAGAGNDRIHAGYGNDILVGGKGNDYLQGYYGADTYIFSRGDGQDIVDENNSDNSHSVVDKIVFTDINREDVIFTKENNSDVTIKVKGSEDKVTIKNAHSNDWQIEEIHFANGEVMTYEEMMKQPFEYYGDEKDNTINTYSTDDKIFAGAGNDRIHAGDGNNIVYGGEGNDEIRSGRGNDTLVGGKGNDYLNGGYGNDTYVFRQGYGNDTIFDENGSQDKVITASDMLHTIFEKDGNDMRMTIAGREDSVTVKNWYSSDSYKIEEFHGEEKSMITSRQIDLLIQAMASFSQEKGISWSKAIEERPTEVEAVVQNFWAKQM